MQESGRAAGAKGPLLVGKKPRAAPKDEQALFDEYRPGLKQYSRSSAAGSYKMNVSKSGVSIDFYAGDSQEVSKQFILR